MRRMLTVILAALVVASALPCARAQEPEPPYIVYLPYLQHSQDCRMTAILRITDGTTTINLVKGGGEHGWHLEDWTPAIADYKGGGVWQDSPLADGRRLTVAKWDLAIETIGLKATAADQDDAARELQEMRRLLEKAASYWTSEWQDEPVWIEARAACETNTRYALIHRGRIPEEDSFYRQPFLQPSRKAVLDNITLILERDHWLGNTPGTGTATELSAVESYDGRNLGNVDETGIRDPTSSKGVYVANQRAESNITDIYVYDAAPAGWSTNRMDAALPYNLYPDVPAADDIVYFGTDTSLANSGPFKSLVFDIGVVETRITGITWEYHQGAVGDNTWVGLPSLQDYTNDGGAMTGVAFNTAGVGNVSWQYPDDWTAGNLQTIFGGAAPNITGYWVRARVTGTDSATPPTQANRDVYAVAWPYVEIQEDQLPGDTAGLVRLMLYSRRARSDETRKTARVMIGARSYYRGSGFTAFINASDEQNPSGVTVSGLSYSDVCWTPTGRLGAVTVASGGGTQTVKFTFANIANVNYYGVYHVYLRAWLVFEGTGYTEDVSARLQLLVGPSDDTADRTVTYAGSWITFSDNCDNQPGLLDVGQVDVPSFALKTPDVVDTLDFAFTFRNVGDVNVSVRVIELILIPVDEWAAHVQMIAWGEGGIEYGTYLDLDSITTPKTTLASYTRRESDGYAIAPWCTASNGPCTLQSNRIVRLWFVWETFDPNDVDAYFSLPDTVIAVQVQHTPRYFSLRGAR